MLSRRDHEILFTAAEGLSWTGFTTANFDQIIEDAVESSGRQSKRKSPLRPRLIIYLIIAMAMFRHCSIVNVFEKLLSWGRGSFPGIRRGMVCQEALYHARARLGVLPVKAVFKKLIQSAVEIRPAYKGHCFFAIDSTQLTLPDTVSNRSVFGSHTAQNGPVSFPQLRAVSLVELADRRIIDCCFIPCKKQEHRPVPYLLRNLRPGDVLLVDRGLFSRKFIQLCLERGAHVLFRAKWNWKPRVVKKLGRGEYLVRPAGCSFDLRLIEICVQTDQSTSEVYRLVTSLMDRREYPAEDLARQYHRRWDCELAYGELKCEMLAQTGAKQQTHFRSKTAFGILQEAWGMAIAHTLIRNLMLETSDRPESGLTSTQSMSFASSKETIINTLPWLVSSESEASRDGLHIALIEDLATCVLRRPRRNRHYPRTIKKIQRKYRLRGKDYGERFLTIRIALAEAA